MELTLEKRDGFVLARTRGVIGTDSGAAFREHLHPIVGDHGARVVVDLSGSERINSDGLAQLVRLVSDANTRGSQLVFAAPTPFVANVFSITRLDTFFRVVGTVEEAMSAVASA